MAAASQGDRRSLGIGVSFILGLTRVATPAAPVIEKRAMKAVKKETHQRSRAGSDRCSRWVARGAQECAGCDLHRLAQGHAGGVCISRRGTHPHSGR